MLDFSIDPVHFYIRLAGRDVGHTDDFNRINTLWDFNPHYEVYLWSDTHNDYINCTLPLKMINFRLGFTPASNRKG
jgi:hypothetical protein